MQRADFDALAQQGYNRIPLVSEALADLETPLSLYLKLTQAHGTLNTFLLESVVGGERFGRYSIIGLQAKTLIKVSGGPNQTVTQVITDGKVVETDRGNPLDFISNYHSRFKVALKPGLPRFCGGLAGYFGYDTVRHIEKKLVHSCPPDDLGMPDILLLQTEELAVIDNLSGKLSLIVYADPAQPNAYAQAQARLAELKLRLKAPAQAPSIAPCASHPAERSFAKDDYLAAVLRAKDLIAAGDFMQVQVGQRIHKKFTASPLSLYRALRALNPSPYMYYYNLGDAYVVGASPEILVRQESTPEGQKVTIRPLAGTRPRGATPEADKAAEVELINDPKERAEHVMLIDLARNDLGRMAQTGSVKVTEAFGIERYSHVMHIVSTVVGELAASAAPIDALFSVFPAGTLSGAPKPRAMEIIERLEPTRRGLYGGAIGYFDFTGNIDTCIAIRTALIKGGRAYVQAGAGVVADSDPDSENQETLNKAAAVLTAINTANAMRG